MTQKKIIEPSSWTTFLSEFSERNNGRRARFEIFGPGGAFREEEQEGHFERAAVNGNVVEVTRTYESQGQVKTMVDKIESTRGIEIQYDTDGSEDTIEFMNQNGDVTVLHFESLVDGDS